MGSRLKGKVAVVTGAGRGIGREIALLMAQEGAAVVVNDFGMNIDVTPVSLNPVEETVAAIQAAGGQGIANCDSVSDFKAAENIIATAVRAFGRIDILVNNAGIRRDGILFNLSEEEWDTVIAMRLKGTFNCSRHASVRMREQKSGRIISMSSTSGIYGNVGLANYGAASDGIAGFTRVVSRDLGRYGITVNAIATVETRTLLPLPHRNAEDIAPFATYLATDAAANINGQIFIVTGGVVSLLNYPAPVRTIAKQSRWTAEEIAVLFPSTLGMELFNPAPAQPAEPR